MSLDLKLIKEIIRRCVSIKADIVTRDEREKKGIRTILNFGHTLAHAVESAAGYGKTPHGYAVAIGMSYAAYLSDYLGLTRNKSVSQDLLAVLHSYALPTTTTINHSQLYNSLIYDKKFISGKIRMVLLREIGQVTVKDGIRPEEIKKTLRLFSRGPKGR